VKTFDVKPKPAPVQKQASKKHINTPRKTTGGLFSSIFGGGHKVSGVTQINTNSSSQSGIESQSQINNAFSENDESDAKLKTKKKKCKTCFDFAKNLQPKFVC
jgi:hypothetical protein